MSAGVGSFGTEAARRYYAMLMVAYPKSFRVDHGDDAADVFVDLARATRRRGFGALVGLMLRTAPRVVADGIEERNAERRPPVDDPRRSRRPEMPVRDLKHAARALGRRPGFAVTAILTLALGIGATVAVFSVVDAVLLRPLAFPEPEELIVVAHVVPEIASGEWGLSRGGYFYFREHAETLEDLGAFNQPSVVLTGDGPPQRIQAARVTAPLLTTLGVDPEIGRPIGPDDDLPGAAPVVLLGHDLWAGTFGSDAGIVGRRVTLSGETYEVIGVMPADFRFPAATTQLWMPMGFDPAARPINQHTYGGIARLRPGVTVDEALVELRGLVGRFEEEMPTAYGDGFIQRSGFQVVARGLLEDTVGSARNVLWIVLAAASLVLIIACANVANLLNLRSEGRRQEIAVRAALGASRAALLRYALSEAAVIAALAAALGLALAWVGVRFLVLAAPAGLARLDEISMHPSVAAIAVAGAGVITLVLGASSAFGDSNGLVEQLKGGSRSSSPDRRRMRVRASFVVTQVALAVVLTVGCGLLLRSFSNLRQVDPGFDADNVLTMQLSVARDRYEDGAAVLRFFEQVTDGVQGLPGVSAAGVVTGLPLISRAADNANGFADLPDGTEQTLLVDTKFAGPGYFEAMGMRLLEGRFLEERDMREGSLGAVITRTLADETWPGESPLGKRVRPLMQDYPWHHVVGVVDDIRTEDLTRAPEATIYFPYTDLGWSQGFYIAVRTEGPPMALLPAIRSVVWELDADVPLAAVSTMDELVADHLSRTSFTLTLVGVACVMALFLCAVGMYGVIAYSVSQRRFEIGVRMALGAAGGQVAGMVLRQTLTVAAVGIALGLALAAAGTRALESMLFEVTAGDPFTMLIAATALGLLAALAGALPARRATRVDAIVALQRD